MAYSNFNILDVQRQFGLTIRTGIDLFPHVPPVDPGPTLTNVLAVYGQLGLTVNTEKARSEWLIAPVLGELWSRAPDQLCVLSGVDFTVDAEAGLNGVCDFLIGRGPQLPMVTAPVLVVVEAKNESVPSGQGQCAAELVAVQRFNRREGTEVATLYGVITIGDNWRFMRLVGRELTIDIREYLIADLAKLFGILLHVVGLNPILT